MDKGTVKIWNLEPITYLGRLGVEGQTNGRYLFQNYTYNRIFNIKSQISNFSFGGRYCLKYVIGTRSQILTDPSVKIIIFKEASQMHNSDQNFHWNFKRYKRWHWLSHNAGHDIIESFPQRIIPIVWTIEHWANIYGWTEGKLFHSRENRGIKEKITHPITMARKNSFIQSETQGISLLLKIFRGKI